MIPVDVRKLRSCALKCCSAHVYPALLCLGMVDSAFLVLKHDLKAVTMDSTSVEGLAQKSWFCWLVDQF